MTLAPPDTDSDDGRDDMLKLALAKLIEVSSGEENYNPQESQHALKGSIMASCFDVSSCAVDQS